jgi:uracil permease
MNKNNLIYDTHENPRSIKEWILYAVQMLMAVFVATILISNVCGTPVDAGLLGACLGTLVYQLITKFKSPVFISNSGATVSAVCGALVVGSGIPLAEYMLLPYEEKLLVDQNYFAVFIGGLVICAIYAVFALIIKKRGIDAINKLFPPYIVGPITIVIGLNLAGFIPTYLDLTPAISTDPLQWWSVLIAISVMIVVATTSHYFKGFLKTIPFLIGLVFGFIVCLLVELTFGKAFPAASFGIINRLSQINSFFDPVEVGFIKWSFEGFNFQTFVDVVLLFAPVAICALCEHYSDHAVMSNIVGHDLTEDPGLHRTLLGDGVASAIGTVFGGQPNTSYGESTAMVGFSRVASVKVVSLAAIMMGLLAFIEPVQVFISAIPSCVFGGCAMILYGYIACSGIKTLMRNKVDLEDNKKLIITSVILTVGVSGVFLFSQSFAGVSLAMVLGVLLNLILKNKK